MRRILHWFLACLPWTILLSFRSTSFFIHCSFHRFIEFPLVSPLISLVSKKFLQRSKTCLPFHPPFSFQKLINRSLSSTLMNENIRETIRIWYGIDSKWIELKRSAISSRLNKIISFPFLYISRDTPFYRDKRFIKTELCTTSLDPFSVSPFFLRIQYRPLRSLSLYHDRFFVDRIMFETAEIQRRHLLSDYTTNLLDTRTCKR